MPQTWQLALLGIVQGLTEFLPVSSSAHLVFAQAFLGVEHAGVLLEAVVHAGTVAAVLILYGRDLITMLVAWARSPRASVGPGRPVWLLLWTTAVTGALGFAFRDFFVAMFASVRATALHLVLTGFLLWWSRERGRRGLEAMTWADAGWIGLAQAVAIVPGISRSGITIAAGLWRGLSGEEAARYSFLASVPAILGAASYSLATEWQAAVKHGYDPANIVVAFGAAALSGVAAVLWLVQFVRRGQLRAFAYYCWVVGAMGFAWSIWKGVA